MASSRAAPVIIQLVITYFVIAFIVRAVRRAGKASRPPAKPDHRGFSAVPETPLTARPSSPVPPRSGGSRREERMYNGVVWHIVHRTRRDLSQTSGSRAAVDETYVEEPPRCPKCGLGVVETHSWLGYIWSCPECGTRSRSPASIEETARALARRP
jgi:ribosomal protein L37AE/L43A